MTCLRRARVDQGLELPVRHFDDIINPQGKRFFSNMRAVNVGAAFSFVVAEEIPPQLNTSFAMALPLF
jgi:hypothetical protein